MPKNVKNYLVDFWVKSVNFLQKYAPFYFGIFLNLGMFHKKKVEARILKFHLQLVNENLSVKNLPVFFVSFQTETCSYIPFYKKVKYSVITILESIFELRV